MFTSSLEGGYLPIFGAVQTVRRVLLKFSTTPPRNTFSLWTRCRRHLKSVRDPTQASRKRLQSMKLQQLKMLNLRKSSPLFTEKMVTWTT